ncbi:F0F1 ATP synthase subunit B [Aeoliella sp. ICT_H6.2]|uniref:ATP synthase subunit b n=1 Tax=Aeoliella straminimaris TaxID=2954799 RepID=A0A9X2JKD8_9BACT|nr:F0F1 ATP synthase subunit B [Aeoliella straminimaris]MCO6048148.1 F0F1 ATP synthase subunit B [Aeoliella straminimaris]
MSAVQPVFRWLLAGYLLVILAGGATTVRAAEHAGGEAADAAHHGAAESGGGNPLLVDPDLAIYTAIVFGVLVLVLWKFAWGPIVTALDTREQTVRDHLAAAEAKHEEAKGLLAAHEARLAMAKDEVREMLEEARRDAEATKTQIVAEAESAASARHDRVIRDIEQARDSAVRQLAETSANLAVDLAGKVVQQNLTAEQQAELVREATGKLAAASPSNN